MTKQATTTIKHAGRKPGVTKSKVTALVVAGPRFTAWTPVRVPVAKTAAPAPVKVAGAYRTKPLADPKTIALLYVGLYKPVWPVVGPMETVRVQLAADVALRGPTQKAVAGLAGSPTTALSIIQGAQALGHKNALGVVNHMINTGQLTVLN